MNLAEHHVVSHRTAPPARSLASGLPVSTCSPTAFPRTSTLYEARVAVPRAKSLNDDAEGQE
jgi:hypothetical protein